MWGHFVIESKNFPADRRRLDGSLIIEERFECERLKD
jgi:hypothetical protein